MSPLVLAILGPLSGAIAILLLRRGAGMLALAGAATGLLASFSLLAAVSVGTREVLVLPGLPGFPLTLVADPLAALLSTVVAAVGTLVLIYAIGYMREESGRVRFFALMSLFLAAMQTLVLAGDWIMLLSAWEIIGFCSYLLIGFWFERPDAASAATRAFLYTRSADLGLYLAVFLLIDEVGSSSIMATLDTAGGVSVATGLLLLFAAMGKSAQVPLQDWLMRAMAGPTPVSALLHSATLVAAGAILLVRTGPALPPEALLAVGVVGGVTAVITGLIALAETDLKRLLAASTASQYGLMLVAVGAGAPLAALLHLVAHAAIKSGLFLSAGIFQHAQGSTGFDELRGAGRTMPWTFAGFAVAALALAGLPPLSGFFSKDAIIAAALAADQSALLVSFAFGGTVLTGAYLGRALRLLWRGSGHSEPVSGMAWMGTGLAGLVTLAIILGASFEWIAEFVGSPLPESAVAVILGLGAAVGGLALGAWIPAQRLLGPLYPAARRGFVIGGGLSHWVARPMLTLARRCDSLELRLYRATLGIGHLALLLGRPVKRLEQGLYAVVFAVGRWNLGLGRLVRRTDERQIDGAIFALASAVRAAGARARSLQSGLIHRELAITTVGVAVMFAVLIAAMLRFE